MSEDITERIVDRVGEQCSKKGRNLSRAAASLISRIAHLLDASGGRHAHLLPEQLDSVVQRAVEMVCALDRVQIDTIHMQTTAAQAAADAGRHTALLERNHRFKTDRLCEEIATGTDESRVFADMVLYVLHETGLLDKRKVHVVESETRSALESVVPRHYVRSFIAQSVQEKHSQLLDLWKIVWGIQLFHRESRKGGAWIEPFEERILQDVHRFQKDTATEMIDLEKKIASYTQVIAADTAHDPSKLRRLQAELVNRQQYYTYLSQHKRASLDAEARLKDLRRMYQSHIDELRRTVDGSSVVSKSTVYPMFIVLAETWQQFQHERSAFQEIRHVHEQLRQFRHTYEATLTIEDIDAAKELAAEEPDDSDEGEDSDDEVLLDRGVATVADSTVGPGGPEPVETDDIPPELEFNGFDIVSVIREGIPAPANYHVGFIEYDGRFYGFSSARKRAVFKRSPQRFLAAVPQCVQSSPDLIHLLGVEGRLLPPALLLSTDGLPVKQMVSMEVQTETHPIERHIDREYEFSEWKLRKQALQIADLRNKRTHSTQTHESGFRKEQQTQVYLPKDSETQTLIDKGTSPVKQARYIKGLRGPPSSSSSNSSGVRIVNMTFEQS